MRLINCEAILDVGLVILRGFLCGGHWLPARIALVVVAERRLETVLRQAANHGPTNAAAISTAIGFGIDQNTGQGASANRFEELRGGARDKIGAGPTRRIFRSCF